MQLRKRLALAVLLAAVSGAAVAVQEQTPEPGRHYRVVDVAGGDVLHVRAQPDAGAESVGSLAADAADVRVAGTRVQAGDTVWWQVLGPEGPGWVNARYLTLVDPDAPQEANHPLRCAGTEPFWSLTVGDGAAHFQAPGHPDAHWQAGPMVPASGLRGRYAVRLQDGDGVGHAAAWRNHHFCSDGMSDIGYPYEGILVTPQGDVYAGCCARAQGAQHP